MPTEHFTRLNPTHLIAPHRVHRQAFVDPAVFDLEMTRVFSSTWVYVGHESEVAEPGSYKATTLGTQPVLLTRDLQGTLHVFINACRHRGVLLADDHTQGTCRHFVCPYHGWTFDLSGKLVSVPMRDRQASV
ncbi:MAG: aromatic ring-hydroxylating oxygenase subunit alpha, partial [Immundisolibacter sp.]|uniref:aromatic ring-hydroxylating oxygenase subunit alpha n=1 Tax=Immundisolibacter sp. TaxID=1934948 RepID=UPI003EE09312